MYRRAVKCNFLLGHEPFPTLRGLWGVGPQQRAPAAQVEVHSTITHGGRIRKTHEIPGPENLGTWQQCWAVFRTACIMEDIAHPATLDLYAYKFSERCGKFPGLWWLCAQADITCRQEYMIETHRAQVGFEHHTPGSTQVNWKKPWDYILRMLAEDEQFWGEELKDKAIAWQMRPKPVQHAQGAGGQQHNTNVRNEKRNKPAKPAAGDTGHPNIYFMTRANQEICKEWNRSAS